MSVQCRPQAPLCAVGNTSSMQMSLLILYGSAIVSRTRLSFHGATVVLLPRTLTPTSNAWSKFIVQPFCFPQMSSHPFFRLGLSQVPASLAERLGGLKQPTPPAPRLEAGPAQGWVLALWRFFQRPGRTVYPREPQGHRAFGLAARIRLLTPACPCLRASLRGLCLEVGIIAIIP